MTTMKRSILLIIYSGWSGLGFIRGVNYHKYTYNEFKSNKSYMYSDLIIYGLWGTFVYANPFFLPFTIHKEIYKLETNIRNLENEKKSSYYNKLI